MSFLLYKVELLPFGSGRSLRKQPGVIQSQSVCLSHTERLKALHPHQEDITLQTPSDYQLHFLGFLSEGAKAAASLHACTLQQGRGRGGEESVQDKMYMRLNLYFQ